MANETNPKEFLKNPNVLAFLRAIRLGEGTTDEKGYQRIVGGAHFEDFSDHPRQRIWIERYKVWSTAAGAYQFIASTWDEMAQRYKLTNFSPENQDIAAVGLLIRRKAIPAILAGKIEEAIWLCRNEWASLPGSPHGQRTEKLDKVLAEYVKWGGKFHPVTAEEPAPAPIEESKPVIVNTPPEPVQRPGTVEMVSNLWKALQAGKKLANSVTWKKRQNAVNAITVVLLGGVGLMGVFGYELKVDEEVLAGIGAGVWAVVSLFNNWVTTATTADVGLQPKGRHEGSGDTGSDFPPAI